MPTLVSLNGNIAFKRGNTAKNLTYTGPDGTISIDTEKKEIRLHDGVTAGGVIANQNAATAVKLATARTINGVAFDGTANITINATDSTARIASSEKGAANGVATLDAGGKVPVAQLPDSVLGGMVYQGTWNASTNSPALTSSTGTKGHYYKVSVDGTTAIDTINKWQAGDLIAFNGTTWDKIDGGISEVYSVAGRTGDVVLTKTDVGLANVANVDTTNAANISTGTLPAARLPAFSGDATTVAGASVITLANTGVAAGVYEKVTVDAKGRVTAGGDLIASDIMTALNDTTIDCGLIP